MIRRELDLDMRQLAWLAGLMEGEGTFVKGSPSADIAPLMGERRGERIAALAGDRAMMSGGRRRRGGAAPHRRQTTSYT
jgi:hypothetical protein